MSLDMHTPTHVYSVFLLVVVMISIFKWITLLYLPIYAKVCQTGSGWSHVTSEDTLTDMGYTLYTQTYHVVEITYSLDALAEAVYGMVYFNHRDQFVVKSVDISWYVYLLWIWSNDKNIRNRYKYVYGIFTSPLFVWEVIEIVSQNCIKILLRQYMSWWWR